MKKIPNYENYKVDEFGNVLSIRKNRNLTPFFRKNMPYLYVNIYKKGKIKQYSVHQIVAITYLNHVPCGYKWVVNHKDFNQLNNHVSNLEIVSVRENNNQKHLKSSSQYTGVTWHKRQKKWIARISVGKRLINLGSFTNEIEASLAYEKELKKITRYQPLKKPLNTSTR